jgi:hypothetical protein
MRQRREPHIRRAVRVFATVGEIEEWVRKNAEVAIVPPAELQPR